MLLWIIRISMYAVSAIALLDMVRIRKQQKLITRYYNNVQAYSLYYQICFSRDIFPSLLNNIKRSNFPNPFLALLPKAWKEDYIYIDKALAKQMFSVSKAEMISGVKECLEGERLEFAIGIIMKDSSNGQQS